MIYKTFELTQDQYDFLLTVRQPLMLIGGSDNRASEQLSANDKWKKLGEELGFVWDTAKASNKGKMFFEAQVKDEDDAS